MTDENYREWVTWHCKFLCRSHQEYRAMLDLWRSEFESLGATTQELESATRWMAIEWLPGNATAAWAAYPGVLLGWLRRKRRKEQAEEQTEKRRKNGTVRQDSIASLADQIGRGGKMPQGEPE